MCSINTEAIKRRLMTKTGTGPLKIKEKKYINTKPNRNWGVRGRGFPREEGKANVL